MRLMSITEAVFATGRQLEGNDEGYVTVRSKDWWLVPVNVIMEAVFVVV